MRLCHLADLHLGYRAYARNTPTGVNQREWDVAHAFEHVVQQVVEARPDLIVVAGDHFHTVRPSNHAVTHAYRQWRFVTEQLPGVPTVIVAGNHDLPRTSEAGCILRLLAELPGIRVALEPKVFQLVCGGCSVDVHCVPETLAPTTLPQPREADVDLLVYHGDTPDLAAKWSGDLKPRNTLHPEQLQGWTYAALGHYHVATQVGERAWYSGSIEYTSSNPWDEVRVGPGKGWLLVDIPDHDTATVTFRPVATRTFLDLDPVDAAGMGPQDITDHLRANWSADCDGWVLRQKVLNISREVARELDHALIREWKARALHYHLDLRRPAREALAAGLPEMRRRPSLAEAVADFFGGRELPPDISREVFLTTAQRLLDEVTQQERDTDV